MIISVATVRVRVEGKKIGKNEQGEDYLFDRK